jgi:hypothetical protein
VDGRVINLNALLGEEFRDTAVGRPPLALGGNEFPMRFSTVRL